MTPKDPLVIKLETLSEFLDVKLLFTSANSNDVQFKISKDKKFIQLDFEYLDCLEGFILQIYHTAESGGAIQLQGKIKGSQLIKRKSLKFLSTIFYDKLSIFKSSGLTLKHKRFILSLSSFFAPFVLLIIFFIDNYQSEKSFIKYVFLFSLLFLTIIYWSLAYRIINSGIPKQFEKYLDDN